jgi:hypothetical protein
MVDHVTRGEAKVVIMTFDKNGQRNPDYSYEQMQKIIQGKMEQVKEGQELTFNVFGQAIVKGKFIRVDHKGGIVIETTSDESLMNHTVGSEQIIHKQHLISEVIIPEYKPAPAEKIVTFKFAGPNGYIIGQEAVDLLYAAFGCNKEGKISLEQVQASLGDLEEDEEVTYTLTVQKTMTQEEFDNLPESDGDI